VSVRRENMKKEISTLVMHIYNVTWQAVKRKRNKLKITHRHRYLRETRQRLPQQTMSKSSRLGSQLPKKSNTLSTELGAQHGLDTKESETVKWTKKNQWLNYLFNSGWEHIHTNKC
jgi:hypothetical protein